MKMFAVIVAGVAAMLLAYGCTIGSPEQRYKVLSFFFDGVPPPGAKKTAEESSLEKRRALALQPSGVHGEHGPYAAKLCNACHEGGSNALILPVEELCLYCHTQVLTQAKKRLHGPVAAGGCTVCHNPHGSQYPYYLLEEPKKFCYRCHNEKDVLKSEVHRDAEEQCTACHYAHSSDNEFLLKQ